MFLFSDIFRGDKKEALAWNRLNDLLLSTLNPFIYSPKIEKKIQTILKHLLVSLSLIFYPLRRKNEFRWLVELYKMEDLCSL